MYVLRTGQSKLSEVMHAHKFPMYIWLHKKPNCSIANHYIYAATYTTYTIVPLLITVIHCTHGASCCDEEINI